MRDKSKFIKPTESNDHPGFFEIPGFNNYLISKEGILYNKHTNKIAHGTKSKAGYQNFSLQTDGPSKYRPGRHRLLCLVFKNSGIDYRELHVNHIDHIPGNDNLDNLEWVTPQENCLHYTNADTGFLKTIVEIRNPRSGQCESIIGIKKAADRLNITAGVLPSMLLGEDWRIYPCEYQVRRKSNEPWPPLPKSEDEIKCIMLHNTTKKSIKIKWLVSGVEKTYLTMGDLCKELKIARPTLSVWVNAETQIVCPGGFLIKYAHDITPWRNDITCLEDMFSVYNSQGERKIVQVTNVNGITNYYWNATSAAKAMNIATTALDYRLKSRGKSLFEDLHRYGYYPFDISLEPSIRRSSKNIIERKINEMYKFKYFV